MSHTNHSLFPRFLFKIAFAFFALSLFGVGQAHAATAPTYQEKTVVLYGTSWCIYCKESRTYFRDHGIDFTDYDVESSPEIQAKFKAIGGSQVPLIIIGTERIQGFNPQAIDQALAKVGIQKK